MWPSSVRAAAIATSSGRRASERSRICEPQTRETRGRSVATPRLRVAASHLAAELLDEVVSARRHDAPRVLGERDGAEAVDGGHAARSVLGVDAIEAGLGDEVQRLGLEPERLEQPPGAEPRRRPARDRPRRPRAPRRRSRRLAARPRLASNAVSTRHGRRRGAGRDARALGLAGELDCGAVARPVARHLGPDERDRCPDRGEHLRMLGPDQRAASAARPRAGRAPRPRRRARRAARPARGRAGAPHPQPP